MATNVYLSWKMELEPMTQVGTQSNYCTNLYFLCQKVDNSGCTLTNKNGRKLKGVVQVITTKAPKGCLCFDVLASISFVIL